MDGWVGLGWMDGIRVVVGIEHLTVLIRNCLSLRYASIYTYCFILKSSVSIYKERRKPGRKGKCRLGITLCEEAENKEGNEAGSAGLGLAGLGPTGVHLGGVGGRHANHVPGDLPYAPTRLGYPWTDPIRHFPTRTHTRLCKG